MNEALRFTEDASDYHTIVGDAIEMDSVMQDLTADLTGFEDSTIALVDIMDNPNLPAVHRVGDNG